MKKFTEADFAKNPALRRLVELPPPAPRNRFAEKTTLAERRSLIAHYRSCDASISELAAISGLSPRAIRAMCYGGFRSADKHSSAKLYRSLREEAAGIRPDEYWDLFALRSTSEALMEYRCTRNPVPKRGPVSGSIFGSYEMWGWPVKLINPSDSPDYVVELTYDGSVNAYTYPKKDYTPDAFYDAVVYRVRAFAIREKASGRTEEELPHYWRTDFVEDVDGPINPDNIRRLPS